MLLLIYKCVQKQKKLMVDPFLSIKEVLNFMRMIYGEKPKKNSVTKDSHYYAR